MVSFRKVVFVLCLLPCFGAVDAQIPGPSSNTASAAKTPASPDPLGRETPRGTVMGFLTAAQEENYAVAAQYFQPPPGRRHPNPSEERDLAVQLVAVINQKIRASSLDSLSRDSAGRLDDGFRPTTGGILSGVSEGASSFSVELLRLDDEMEISFGTLRENTGHRSGDF